MSASHPCDPEEPGELSSREKKILASIEQDIQTTDPALARHMASRKCPKTRTPLRAAVRHGTLLIIALVILIVAAAVLPSGSWVVIGVLTTVLLVPWILLFPPDARPRPEGQETAMTVPTRLRQREILHAQLAACRRVDSSYARGAAAALSWLTTGGAAPLTGALSATPHFGGIVRELAAAEAIIYGPVCTSRDYASGVEHALLWAEFATAAPPVPPEGRTNRAGERSATSISPRR